MSERAPYSRVYWSIQHDEKFDGIREDMRLIGSWLTLLVIADQAWPAPAYVPPIVPKSCVSALCEAGLIDSLTGSRYRVHGLDTERERRRDAARSGPKREANGTQTGPKLDPVARIDEKETRRDENETSRAETRDAADVYWQLTGRYPAGKALSWIDNLAATYGHDATARALVKAQTADKNVTDLLSRTQDMLRADARKLDLQEREAEVARLREKRAVPRAEEPWRAELREAIRRQYEGDAA